MFENCTLLSSLDLSHFVTSKVTDMSSLFNKCSSLKKLILKFNTEKVQRMDYMFGSCTSLNSLDISTFNTLKCQNLTNMFENDELDLYMNYSISSNLKQILPNGITPHDINDKN